MLGKYFCFGYLLGLGPGASVATLGRWQGGCEWWRDGEANDGFFGLHNLSNYAYLQHTYINTAAERQAERTG